MQAGKDHQSPAPAGSRAAFTGGPGCSGTQPDEEKNLWGWRSTNCQQAEALMLCHSHHKHFLLTACLNFPWYNFSSYYIFPITIYSIDRIENVSVFMNLFTWQFFSLLREVTFRVVAHLCSKQGLSWTRCVYTRDQSDSTVFPRMQEKHVSAVQVKRRAQLLLVLCLLHRYFPFPHFPPNTSNWFLFVCIKQNVIPELKTISSSIRADSNSLKMAIVTLSFHVRPRSEPSVNS